MSVSDPDSPTPREPEPPEIARPLAEIMAERARRLDGHPAPDELLAYADGALPATEEEDLREHLSVCGECLDLLLLRPGAGDARVRDFETFKAWREMRARIREHEARKELARRTRSLRGLQAIAAVLVLATGLLWVKAGQDSLGDAAPVPNPAIFDVQHSQVRGLDEGSPEPSALQPTAITVPEDIDTFTLVFWLDGPQLDAYEILLRDRDGNEIWRFDDLKVELGTATLGLSRRSMRAGRYRVEIFGIKNDERIRVGDYSIELEYA